MFHVLRARLSSKWPTDLRVDTFNFHPFKVNKFAEGLLLPFARVGS